MTCNRSQDSCSQSQKWQHFMAIADAVFLFAPTANGSFHKPICLCEHLKTTVRSNYHNQWLY